MKFLLSFVLFLTAFCVSAQGEEIWMYPNKGQWESEIKYQVNLNNGKMYLENNRFTFHFYESIQKHHHEHKRNTKITNSKNIHNHVIQHTFKNANPTSLISTENSPHYYNYFLGKNQSFWKTNIRGTQNITYKNFYPNIDLIVNAQNHSLEYSFEIATNTDPSVIQFSLDGAKKISIDKTGNLHYTHDFGEIIEQKLIAWNLDENSNKIPVEINFKLHENNVSFEFPKGYNPTQKLIIDPELIFSTFTGATSDNWGFTATPDEQGNLYAGGISFGVGYPTSTGAFDLTYNGGVVYNYSNNGATMKIPGIDVSISKFNETGTQLLYSTYLGGAGNETPHSIITNANNELFILGATSSADFPVSKNGYDTTFNGGGTFDNKELIFPGSDIFVTKLSYDGTQILGSTYFGGKEIDGLNVGELAYNYGDDFRGEIICSKNGDIIFTSTTQSNDYPTLSPFQTQLQGKQDAVITKLSSDLSTIIWSSYFGGTGDETGNSIQLSTTDEIYFTGGTTSSNLAIKGAYHGGVADGYVAKLSKGIPRIITGNYIGTNEYDQSYFVQLDNDNEVYLFGQSNGDFPISPGKYGVPNSGQFIAKYSNDLNTLRWSTTIGAGTGEIEISPTAFSVSRCADIYITGWGGKVNVENSKAKFSSAVNFPITDDAFQKTTLGDNFYLGVLSKNAEKLKYGSYIGGVNTSFNHVDGGTSRFSKTGGIYHAVCGGCGGQKNGFTTTQGVLSTTNNSSNCNLAAFKFELNKTKAVANVPAEFACLGTAITFKNGSFNATEYKWDLGDGTKSTVIEPTHTYADTGTYKISLIAIDPTGCMDPDTTFIKIQIQGGTTKITEPEIAICPNNSIKLNAKLGDAYQWIPNKLVSDSTSNNPTTSKLNKSTIITAIIKKGCYLTEQTFPIKVYPYNGNITKNQEICRGPSVPLVASGGVTYSWSPAKYLNTTSGSNTISKPDSTITYFVSITTQDNCTKTDSVQIVVIQPDAKVVNKDTVVVCQNETLLLNFTYDSNIKISPNIWITQNSPTLYSIKPFTDVDYQLNYTNACGSQQENFHINVNIPKISAEKDTSICPGGKAFITCKGGMEYIWLNPVNVYFKKKGEITEVSPNQTITYVIKGIDKYKCIDTAYVNINVFNNPIVTTDQQYFVHWGESITLKAKGNNQGSYLWSPSTYLSCVNCQNPTASPIESLDYKVIYTDKNKCIDSSIVHVIFESNLYIPNTFTPNSKDGNDVFKAVAENITNFHLEIYNRWGDNIISLNDIHESWDGTYNGIPCKDGTYTWKLRYIDSFGLEHKKTGHVNLLR